MKNILLFIVIFFSSIVFGQAITAEKKAKLEIRSTTQENEIHRKSNEHNEERITMKKEDQRDHTHKPALERHQRPHLDGKHTEHPGKETLKREHHPNKQNEKQIEQRQEKRKEKREELRQHHKEHR